MVGGAQGHGRQNVVTPPATSWFHIISCSSSSRNERSTNKLRMLWRNMRWLGSRTNTGSSGGL